MPGSADSAYAFIDGTFIRMFGEWAGKKWLHPNFVNGLCEKEMGVIGAQECRRITYYDALPDAGDTLDPDLEQYWERIERAPNTALGWGFLKEKNPRRRKAVDTLITIDMLTGAFNDLFRVAILVTDNADFVPVVYELQRLGVRVVVASGGPDLSNELNAIADYFVPLEEKICSKFLTSKVKRESSRIVFN